MSVSLSNKIFANAQFYWDGQSYKVNKIYFITDETETVNLTVLDSYGNSHAITCSFDQFHGSVGI